MRVAQPNRMKPSWRSASASLANSSSHDCWADSGRSFSSRVNPNARTPCDDLGRRFRFHHREDQLLDMLDVQVSSLQILAQSFHIGIAERSRRRRVDCRHRPVFCRHPPRKTEIRAPLGLGEDCGDHHAFRHHRAACASESRNGRVHVHEAPADERRTEMRARIPSSDAAFIARRSRFVRPSASALCLAMASMLAEMSIPRTDPLGPTRRAAGIAGSPRPVARSRTRIPGPRLARSSIRSRSRELSALPAIRWKVLQAVCALGSKVLVDTVWHTHRGEIPSLR